MAKFDRDALFADLPAAPVTKPKFDRDALFAPEPVKPKSGGNMLLDTAAGLLQGVNDVANSGAQALQPVADAFDLGVKTVFGVSPNEGLKSLGLAGSANEAVQNQQAGYKAVTGNSTAAAGGRLIGNVAATAPLGGINPVSAGALVPKFLARAVNGALQGGTGAVALASANPDLGVGTQTAIGATVGSLLNTILPPVLSGGGKLLMRAAGSGDDVAATASSQADDALRRAGVNLEDLGDQASPFRKEIEAAIRAGDSLDGRALERKAAYLATGAKPRLGTITRDPLQFAREHSLKGLESGQPIADNVAFNNQRFIGVLNDHGANLAPGEYQAGEAVIRPLKSFLDRSQGEISSLYGAARDSTGRYADIDPSAFANMTGDLLDKNMSNAFVPTEIRNMVNDFATGKIPLNVNTAEQFKTIIGRAQRSTQDGNTKFAIGLIRQALDEAPLLTSPQVAGAVDGALPAGSLPSIPGGSLGDEAITAFNKARAANAALRGRVEDVSALKAIEDAAEPDKFFRKYILNSDINQLRKTMALVGDDPEAVTVIKNQVISHLKQKATNGAADEVAQFSQAGYNKALSELERGGRLDVLFSPAELKKLRLLGRVASYEQVAPAGAVVNHSGTATRTMDMLQKTGQLPYIRNLLVDPVRSWTQGSQANQAVRAMPARQIVRPLARGPTSPIAAAIMSSLQRE